MKRLLPIFLSLFLAVGFSNPALSFPSHPQRAEVSPQVWLDLADGQQVGLLVVMRPPAATLVPAWQAEKSADSVRNTYNHLTQTANASQAGLQADLTRLGIPFRAYWLVNAIRVQGDASLAQALAARPDVLRIEADHPFQVLLEPIGDAGLAPQTGIEWNINRINAPAVWAWNYTGQGIVIGNADTGVQWDHPALNNHYRGWNGASADHNYNWWDAIHASDGWTGGSLCLPDRPAPCDDNSHGTHTTGIAVGDDGLGNQVGAAPGAKWIGCRNMYNGVGHPSTYIECLEFFMAPWDSTGSRSTADPSKHANIINNSYGCTGSEGCPSNLLHQAVQAVRSAGIFMAVSAGNNGQGCGSVIDPPGLYLDVFTIGNSDSSNTISASSSRGPVTFGGQTYRKPDLTAPGTSIRSSIPTNGYGYKSGTSMSAPLTAGSVALLWSAFPPLRGDVLATESLLRHTAAPKTTSEGCGGDTFSDVPNNTYGWGLLDVNAAYQRELSSPIVIHQALLPLVSR